MKTGQKWSDRVVGRKKQRKERKNTQLGRARSIQLWAALKQANENNHPRGMSWHSREPITHRIFD
jgi:hypothetical protein